MARFRAFLRSAQLDLAHVAYRGAPPALLDLAARRIQVALVPFAPAAPLARQGRVPDAIRRQTAFLSRHPTSPLASDVDALRAAL